MLRRVALVASMVVLAGSCSLQPPPSSDAVALLETGPRTVTSEADAAPPADVETTQRPPSRDSSEPVETQPPVEQTYWRVGASPLPLRPDGLGEIQPTPQELVDRRLPTTSTLPAPAADDYVATSAVVPADVLERSTWHPGCPVGSEELRYLTLSFWGFDGGHHTGEMLVHADVADAVIEVFGALHAERFPIEEMRVTAAWELDTAPTGDGNNTSAFVCRSAVGMGRWSDHASGLAVDINPFVNPYVRSDGVVIPELASAYTDREHRRDGMILEGGIVTDAFDAVGWTWGGRWASPLDLMHFSATGG
ncbi:D-alanyl-D-alanine carboxypeptidase [Actinoalloteichus hymeniacidonis]|uniref:D-alanyl-D-alanine carboxypeptidase n=2 Tax=Actinoalloteichus hymeniacidonis TaxID=340345 RepID=A0AAC9HNJ6_9PSEU|nr:D-alanyl-D-alanine carboxypeptidase [Actinoalloteichus hymeniacidonis]